MIMRNNKKAADDNVGDQVRGGAPSARGQPAAVPPPPRLPPLHHPQGRAQHSYPHYIAPALLARDPSST